jgi:glycosyltransferase involved in cell wall biosynthesis
MSHDPTGSRPVIDACLCTHNPRPAILERTIASLASQEAAAGRFRFLLVDSASTVPIGESVLAPLRRRGIESRIVREEIPGHARARVRGIRETSDAGEDDWLLFLDDDNELMPDFLAEAEAFASSRDDVGCFGGKLLLPPDLEVPARVRPFLPYLAIKDAGDETIVRLVDAWGPWEPPGAGAMVRRRVAERYRRRAEDDPDFHRLGRSGRRGLASGDDSLLMRGSFALGLANAYVPSLRLYHHLDPRRFRLPYLLRFMHALGTSQVTLETLLGGPQPIPPHYACPRRFASLVIASVRSSSGGSSGGSLAHGIGMALYHAGVRGEHLRRRAAADGA